MARVSGKGDWVSLGGTRRAHLNRKTGEILSRRQYDQRFGIVAKKGQKTYERKAKANLKKNPQLAKARPAPGRSSTLGETKFRQKGKELKVKGKKKFQDIHVTIFQIDGEPVYQRLIKDYDALKDGLEKNKRIFGVAINLGYDYKKGRSRWKSAVINLLPTRSRSSLAPGWLVVEYIERWMETFSNSLEVKPKFLDLHTIFSAEHFEKIVPPKPRGVK